ncbi:MAG: hypothetical protein AAF657_21645 [Acidobacteriota bacterium]
MNRLHGTPLRWGTFAISPSTNADNDDVFVLTSVCNPDTGECGCYDHEAGTCGPCPEINL